MSTARGVSVVIPAFQAADTVAAAVSSALEQVPAPDEVIVVDDGSTDATAEVLAGFGDAIEVLHQANGGEAAARNAGLAAARHEWIAYLDADDWFLPGRLAAVWELLDRDPGLDLVTTDAFMIDGRDVVGRAYGPQWAFATEDQRTEILRRNFVFGHVVVRAETLRAVGGYDTSIARTTDWAAWIAVILGGGRAGLVERPLSTYRIHPTSLSADRVGMALGGLQSLRVAEAHPSLGDRERAVLAASIDEQEALVAREQLAAALDARSPDRRRLASAVLAGRSQPLAQRSKALLAWGLPSLATSLRERRRRGVMMGTAGRPMGASTSEPTGPGDVRGLVSIVVDEPSAVPGAGSVGEVAAGAARTMTSLSDQSLPVVEVIAGHGRAALGRARTGTFAVVPTGTVLDPGAIERRLLGFAWRCEAAAVVDLVERRPGEPEPEVAMRAHLPEETWAEGVVGGPQSVLFRVSALREEGVGDLTPAAVPGVVAQLARRHPIVVLDRREPAGTSP
jgi:hypothetical protein